MRKAIRWLLIVGLLAAVAAALYVWRQGPTYKPPVDAPSDLPPPVSQAAEPQIRYPVPETAEEALPALEKSDPAVLAALSDLLGRNTVRQMLQPQEVVRRIVVTLDNLPRKNVSGQLLPYKPLSGKLRTTGQGEELALSPASQERYKPYVRVLEMVDAEKFGTIYRLMYPLFQNAYRDLGYPKGYFNDRLVAVIDHMLDAPQSEGRIALVQPHVFYKFADPELESLSAGHKLMIRMGNDNAGRVKAKLRQIRDVLTAQSVPAADKAKP